MVVVVVLGFVSLWVTPPVYAQDSKTSRICINVFNDNDADGRFESGEALVIGAVVQLNDDNGREITQYITTESDAAICIEVGVGQYHITVKPPDGLAPTTLMSWEFAVPENTTTTLEFGTLPAIDGVDDMYLGDDQISSSGDPVTSLCVIAYHDANLNGERDVDEELQPSTIIELQDTTGARIASHKIEESAGCFLILPEQYYRVLTIAPSGYVPTTLPAWEIWIPSGGIGGLDFGVGKNADIESTPNAALCAAAFLDLNRNGLKEPTDRVADEIKFEIFDSSARSIGKGKSNRADEAECFFVPANETFVLVATPSFGYILENPSTYEKNLLPNESAIFDIAIIPRSIASTSFASVAPFFIAFLPLIVLALLEMKKQRPDQ